MTVCHFWSCIVKALNSSLILFDLSPITIATFGLVLLRFQTFFLNFITSDLCFCSKQDSQFDLCVLPPKYRYTYIGIIIHGITVATQQIKLPCGKLRPDHKSYCMCNNPQSDCVISHYLHSLHSLGYTLTDPFARLKYKQIKCLVQDPYTGSIRLYRRQGSLLFRYRVSN